MPLSTPGRHRKPRTSQTKRLVATAGLGTAGIALPLIGATSASAASVSTWDKVAQCESGGDWTINTGNGYYGGLQFSASTWSAYGGGQYASAANHATKGQQISIAEKVLASQGPGAWPVCGPQAGLSQGGAAAPVDTSTPAPTPTQTTTPTPTQSPAPSATLTTSSAASSTESSPSPAPSSASSAGKHRKPAPTPTTTPPQAAPVQAVAATPAPRIGPGNYTVKSGDSLSAIAEAAHLNGGWQPLYQANKATVGGNPDLIYPGQHLQIG